MVVNLCGVRVIDFEGKDGNKIHGLKIFISYEDPNVTGFITDNKFLSGALCSKLGIDLKTLSAYVGQVVDIECDLSGKILSISSVEG